MANSLPVLPNSSYMPPHSVATVPTVQTLPSPPAHEAELSKNGHDVTGHGSLLASRRQNVSLPAFSFPSPTQRTFNYGVHGSTSSLLTPPSGNDAMSPVESGHASVSTGYWTNGSVPPPQGPSNYPYGSGASSHASYSAAPALSGSPAYSTRGILSPASSASRSHPLSPSHQDTTVPSNVTSPFDPPPFGSGVSVASHNPQHYNPAFSYPINQSNEAFSGPSSSLPPPTPSPGYYSHPGSSYNFSGHLTTQPRPPVTGALSHLHSLHSPTALAHGNYPHPQRYMPVGLTTNVYAQHGQSVVNGLGPHLTGGGPLHHAQIHHQHAAVPHQERPFRCDQCPQSFNRNHDLKRHKRIHLAVKPFPCPNCDKSFSRKDALKRHVLVKGCGNAGSSIKAGGTSL